MLSSRASADRTIRAGTRRIGFFSALLAKVVASNLAVYGHPTSTAPMGGPTDPWAVVDSLGLVQGVDRLRVVDASIIPEVPSTVTNITVIMLAERIFQRAYA